MPGSHRCSSQRAQSMIEYSLITILVIAGILILGPYLIRSINAYFKSMEDGVEDSFSEHTTLNYEQAPVSGLISP